MHLKMELKGNLDITETSCDSVDKEIKGNIRDDLTLLSFVAHILQGEQV